MLLLNFAHPITDEQQAQITRLLDLDVIQERLQIVNTRSHLNINQPFAEQMIALLDTLGITSEEWQSIRLLINYPALSSSAILMLAELHGRCGYFPPAIRLKQEDGVVPPRYVLAEALDLQGQRQKARTRR